MAGFTDKTQGGYNEIAESLGIHPETLLLELERENRELRRANEILKAASAFFARELDPKPPR